MTQPEYYKHIADDEIPLEEGEGRYALRLREVEKDLKRFQDRLNDLRKHCPHRVVPDGPRDEEWGYGDGVCAVCKGSWGWYCPDSPDHVCHYYSHGRRENGDGSRKMVLTIWDSYIPVPDSENDDHKYESDDYCLFCGAPEERK